MRQRCSIEHYKSEEPFVSASKIQVNVLPLIAQLITLIFRCKLCHFTNDDECEQLKHGLDQHNEKSPLYNVTSAAIVLGSTLNSCFGDYMPADQQEFCEEMSSVTGSDSPQCSPQHPAPKSN
jgi:hypothetical protein